MATVSLKKLTKRYGTMEIVHGIDLDVADREFIALVGPSGCGKSTTLRMIAGLEEISGGTIEIGGRVVNDLAPRARNISMVFQSYALYPHMTVRENLGFSLKIAGVAEAEKARRVAEASAILGLDALLERRPSQLSGGQRQRVAMGRAIVRDPDVFLFDEPLSNLDAKLRTQMRTEIKRLHAKVNATVIYVTHDQVEAMTMADRIVVMNQGVIEQVGTPGEIYQHPATPFVADFVGKTNILPARLGDAGRVHVGQYELTCGTLNGCRSGEDIRVFFRPEDVRVRDLDGLDDGANVFDGAVEKIEFLGAFSRVTLRMHACEHPLYADLSPADMQALQPATGGALRFAVPSAAVRVFRQG